MRVPLRIVPLVGGLLFLVLALGIVLPPLFDVLDDPEPADGLVVLMLLFVGAAPAFVGVRLIQRATRSDDSAVAATPPMAATASSPSYDAVLPLPPSVRREQEAARAAATAALGGSRARSWAARLRALAGSSLGLAILVGAMTMPLMVLLRPAGAYVATIALTIYAIFEIGRSTIGQSWFISALTSAGTGLMLFIVLGATAGALEHGEGNNPVLVLPGMLFYAGIGLTGIARLFWRG